MDNLQISSFLAVAHTQSFSLASAILYRSQPMVSRQIKSLEAELGVELFNRSSRPVTLTEAGRTLEQGLKKIEADYSRLVEAIRTAKSGFTGEVKISVHAGYSYSQTLVPIISEFERLYPNIRVILYSAHSGEVRNMLHNTQTDFVYARWSDYESYDDFSGCVVARLKGGILVSAEHPCAGEDQEKLSLSDFSEDNFIVLPDNIAPGQSRRLERACWAAGFDPKILHAPNNDTALLWLEARKGVSAVLEEHILASKPGFRFLPITELESTNGAIIWNNRHLSHSAELFREHVENYINNTAVK